MSPQKERCCRLRLGTVIYISIYTISASLRFRFVDTEAHFYITLPLYMACAFLFLSNRCFPLNRGIGADCTGIANILAKAAESYVNDDGLSADKPRHTIDVWQLTYVI